jgi:signal recognition particle receptor subunit beta
MVFFNYALRKLNAKIVYYGPGLCGKTTNLQWIHDHFEGGQRGKMISLATEGDRTIFFDLLPIDIGSIRGMDVTLQLYTVPGQVHYNSTRQLVLRGADGVVFVADSQRTMKASNIESFENLQDNLMLQGIDLKEFPHVLQFNKRDLGDLLSPEELNESLNVFSVPIFEGVATEGIGVQETLEGIVKLVMRNLRQKYEPVAGTGPQAPAPMRSAGPVPIQADAPTAEAPSSPAPAPPSAIPMAPQPPPSMPVAEAPPEPEPAVPVAETVPATPFEAPAPDSGTPASEPAASEVEHSFPEAEVDESVSDAMQGMDADFTTFVDEDKVTTDVYGGEAEQGPDEVASSAPPAVETAEPVFAVDRESPSSAPVVGARDEDVDGLFTDPRDEDGTGDGYSSDQAPGESAAESVDDIFGPEEAFAEKVPDEDEEPDTVIAPPKQDQYVDRIEAPSPFAPAQPAAASEPAASAGHEVADQVRQALGASEDREALASLAEASPEGPTEPPEDRPVEPSPVEEPSPEFAVEEGLPTGQVFPPVDEGVEEPPAFAAPDEDVPEFVEPHAEEPLEFEPEVEEPAGFEAEAEKSEFFAPTVEQPVFEQEDVQAEAIDETPAEEPPMEEAPAAVKPPPPGDDQFVRSRPIMVHRGDPFVDETTGVGTVLPVALPGAIDVSASDNQLHLQLKGSGAIAEMGQVRALDIEVPVPGQWVGNRKVTLQLRLTLTPAEEEDG